MPAGPKGPSQPLTGVDGWYINTNAADPELAVDFALEMVKAENEQVFVDTAGHIPADTTITITDPITQKFAEAVATGFPRPQVAAARQLLGQLRQRAEPRHPEERGSDEGGHRRLRRDEQGEQDPVAGPPARPRPGAGSAGARTRSHRPPGAPRIDAGADRSRYFRSTDRQPRVTEEHGDSP